MNTEELNQGLAEIRSTTITALMEMKDAKNADRIVRLADLAASLNNQIIESANESNAIKLMAKLPGGKSIVENAVNDLQKQCQRAILEGARECGYSDEMIHSEILELSNEPLFTEKDN